MLLLACCAVESCPQTREVHDCMGGDGRLCCAAHHDRMIVEPEDRLADFAKAGSDIISVHAEQSSTIHLHRVVNQVSVRLHVQWISW